MKAHFSMSQFLWDQLYYKNLIQWNSYFMLQLVFCASVHVALSAEGLDELACCSCVFSLSGIYDNIK